MTRTTELQVFHSPGMKLNDEDFIWARNARAAHPEMTPYGFTKGSDDQWGEDLSIEHLAEIAICRRWLEARVWRRTADKSCITSYAAKHVVENWASLQLFSRSYVREGALLLAAVQLKLPLLRKSHHWGAYLGISKRDSLYREIDA